MKILKSANIKQTIIDWLKTVYTDAYEVDAGHYYTTIRMKEVGSVDLSFLNRRRIRVKGTTDVQYIGGGVSFGGRRDGSMLVHGGAKSDFGIFDEVELKRRIDHRFDSKIKEKEESRKAQQVYINKINEIEPTLLSYGYVLDNRYSWQKTWDYDKKVTVILRQGSVTPIITISSHLTEEEVLKLAKIIKETLSGNITDNTI
jgi:hypothetical protein